MSAAPLQFLLLVFAGWVNRRQREVVDLFQEENRVLREQLGDRRLRFTDDQRRRLAAKGRALGRRVLNQLGGLVTPDTILRWYRELIAKKYDGTSQRGGGRPGTATSLQRLGRPPRRRSRGTAGARIRSTGTTDSDRTARPRSVHAPRSLLLQCVPPRSTPGTGRAQALGPTACGRRSGTRHGASVCARGPGRSRWRCTRVRHRHRV